MPVARTRLDVVGRWRGPSIGASFRINLDFGHVMIAARFVIVTLLLVPALSQGWHAVPNDAPATHAVRTVSGVVFDDRNADGRREVGEPGIAGVAVSDQDQVVVTDAAGRYTLDVGERASVVFVSVPDGFRSTKPFYHPAAAAETDFPLVAAPRRTSLTVVHASDTHVSPTSLPRLQRLRALVDSIHPDFVIITGDLVRDALRVGEAEATSYYDLFAAEAVKFSVPLWTVPGNHEIFGIERDKSKVEASHPLYGRTMYRTRRGPDYYSFNAGGVHWIGLNTVDIDDTRYYGHVDATQMAWLERDLATVPATVPVITFNHIPFFSSMESVNGYVESPPAPTVIEVGGVKQFRHTVSNGRDVLTRISPHPYPIALGGHIHAPERLSFEGVATRFEQAAAIVAPSDGPGLSLPSGVTVYRIANGKVGAGHFVRLGLDPKPTR